MDFKVHGLQDKEVTGQQSAATKGTLGRPSPEMLIDSITMNVRAKVLTRFASCPLEAFESFPRAARPLILHFFTPPFVTPHEDSYEKK